MIKVCQELIKPNKWREIEKVGEELKEKNSIKYEEKTGFKQLINYLNYEWII